MNVDLTRVSERSADRAVKENAAVAASLRDAAHSYNHRLRFAPAFPEIRRDSERATGAMDEALASLERAVSV